MLVLPYIRLLLLSLLATFVPLVNAKGGGKGSGAKSKGSSRGSSKGKGTITKTTVIVNGQSREQCKDQTNKIIDCPKNNKATIIAVAVVCSVVALVLILVVVYWIMKKRKNKRQLATRTTEVPAIDASQKKEYKPLVDADEKLRESV